MGIFIDLKGTTRDTFKIKKATIDASGLSAARTVTLPDGNINFTGGSSGNVMTLGAGNAWGPAAAPGATSITSFDNIDGNWTAPVGVTKAKVTIIGTKLLTMDKGYYNGYNLLDDGNLYSWGRNDHGQLGDNSITDKSSPVQVTGGLKFKTAQAGYYSCYGVTFDNDVYAWGNNTSGQLGDNSTAKKSSPVAISGGLKCKMVSGSIENGGVITLTNDAYCWGYNGVGACGDGTTTNRSSPVQVIGGLKFKAIFAGYRMFIGLLVDGTAYSWGRNTNGALGDGTRTNRSSPVAVIGGLKFKQISMSPSTDVVVGLTTSNDVYAWGTNTNWMLGVGDLSTKASFTGQVAGMTTDVTITATYGGQLGNTISIVGNGLDMLTTLIGNWNMGNPGNTADETSGDFTQVPDNGANLNLSGGSDGAASSPMAVVGGLKCKMVSSGDNTSHCLTTDNILYCWGYGIYGSLGNNGTGKYSSPDLVVGGLKFKQICEGTANAGGITVDDVLYSWGGGSYGGNGTNNTTTYSSPVQVVGGLSWNRCLPFQDQFLIDVVAGTVYPITLLAKYAQFNYDPLNYFIEKMIIEA